MSSQRTRRDILQFGSLGVASALAGCASAFGAGGESPDTPVPPTGTEEPSPTTTDETATPTPTPTVTAAGDLDIGSVTVWPQVVGLATPDSIATFGNRDEQFVLAMAGGDGPEYDAFELTAASTTYATAKLPFGHGSPSLRTGHGRVTQYSRSGTGYLLFSVSKPLDAEAATVSWSRGGHAVADETTTVLRRSPASFEVRSFGPSAEGSADLELTVANVGDARGIFVGALNRSGPSVASIPVAAIRLSVGPGESATWTIDEELGGEATYKLEWQRGSESVAVTGG